LTRLPHILKYCSLSPAPPMIDRIISHYRIVEKLSCGSMGVTYKANVTLHRFVALKFLPDEVADMSLRFKQH